jgi:hypothetical protein
MTPLCATDQVFIGKNVPNARGSTVIATAVKPELNQIDIDLLTNLEFDS